MSELPILESIDPLDEALSLNRFAYRIFTVAATSPLLGSISPVLVFPWYAIVTSMMYVSFDRSGWDGATIYPRQRRMLTLIKRYRVTLETRISESIKIPVVSL